MTCPRILLFGFANAAIGIRTKTGDGMVAELLMICLNGCWLVKKKHASCFTVRCVEVENQDFVGWSILRTWSCQSTKIVKFEHVEADFEDSKLNRYCHSVQRQPRVSTSAKAKAIQSPMDSDHDDHVPYPMKPLGHIERPA